jgi:hypothetical protein
MVEAYIINITRYSIVEHAYMYILRTSNLVKIVETFLREPSYMKPVLHDRSFLINRGLTLRMSYLS